MITAHALTKRYGATTAVDRLTFEVPGAEVDALDDRFQATPLAFATVAIELLGSLLHPDVTWTGVCANRADIPGRTAPGPSCNGAGPASDGLPGGTESGTEMVLSAAWR